ncbi:NAD(P)/FAD-dependent oxidoreductase [Moorella naiadis]|uniref:geranylgeranyl reductase family protein n=1 Tax=Moorella naiadis (nom. illeg.) TaxID=3093670 RepID=UPI003D9CA4A9
MLNYDAVVVGAGPAGSTAARVMAAAGARVLLVERKGRVGYPVQCAGYVPALISQEVELPVAAVAQPVQTLETFFPDGSCTRTAAPGYILNREILDSALADTSIRAGAELWLRTRVIDLKGEVLVIQRGGERVAVKAGVIIGADGPLSLVARLSGWPRQPLAAAAQVEITLPESLGVTRVYFDPLYRGGYAWVFPKGETANVGVGLMPGEINPAAALAHFLRHPGWQGQRVIRRTGGLIPAGGTYSEVHRGRVLLCGDAGGFTHPVTGAGILTAILSGRLAGEAAAAYLSSGAPLSAYEESWRDLLGCTSARGQANRRRWQEEWSTGVRDLSELLHQTWLT